MNAIRQYPLSKEEKRSLDYAAEKYMQTVVNKISLELDAILLYAVRVVSEKHGDPWGKQRLREVYETTASAREALVKKYEMRNDALFVQLRELKKIGVDLEAWAQEPGPHLVFRVPQDKGDKK